MSSRLSSAQSELTSNILIEDEERTDQEKKETNQSIKSSREFYMRYPSYQAWMDWHSLDRSFQQRQEEFKLERLCRDLHRMIINSKNNNTSNSTANTSKSFNEGVEEEDSFIPPTIQELIDALPNELGATYLHSSAIKALSSIKSLRNEREAKIKRLVASPEPHPTINSTNNLFDSILSTDQSNIQLTLDSIQPVLISFYSYRLRFLFQKKLSHLLRWHQHVVKVASIQNGNELFKSRLASIDAEFNDAKIRLDRLSTLPTPPSSSPNTRSKNTISIPSESDERMSSSSQKTAEITPDDLKLYLRYNVHSKAVSKQAHRFLQRIQWLPASHRFAILERAHALLQASSENEQNAALHRVPTLLIHDIDLHEQIEELQEHFNITAKLEEKDGQEVFYQVKKMFTAIFSHQAEANTFPVYDSATSTNTTTNSKVSAPPTSSSTKTTKKSLYVPPGSDPQGNGRELSLDEDPTAHIKLANETTKLKKAQWLDLRRLSATKSEFAVHQELKLQSLPIDAQLRTENGFVANDDKDYVVKRLKELAETHTARAWTGHLATIASLESPTGNIDLESMANSKSVTTSAAELNRWNTTGAFIATAATSNAPDPPKLKKLSSHKVLALLYLRHVFTRSFRKNTLSYINYFTSIERRLTLDTESPLFELYEEGNQKQRDIREKEKEEIAERRASGVPSNLPRRSSSIRGSMKRRASRMYQTHSSGSLRDSFSSDAGLGSPNIGGSRSRSGTLSSTASSRLGSSSVKRPSSRIGRSNDAKSAYSAVSELSSQFHFGLDINSLNQIHPSGLSEVFRPDSYIYSKQKDSLEPELRVKDYAGSFIMYDAALDTFSDLQDELLRVASHYLYTFKQKTTSDPSTSTSSSSLSSKSQSIESLRSTVPDRLALLRDLYASECWFQEAKFHLVEALMEIYDLTFDVDEREKTAQEIVDTISLRPKYDFTKSYFTETYTSEVLALQLRTKVIKNLILAQKSTEKTLARKYASDAYRATHPYGSPQLEGYCLPDEPIVGQRIHLSPTSQLKELLSKSSALSNTPDKGQAQELGVSMFDYFPSLTILNRLSPLLKDLEKEFASISPQFTSMSSPLAITALQRALLQQVLVEWRLNVEETTLRSQLSQVTKLDDSMLIEDPIAMENLVLDMIPRHTGPLASTKQSSMSSKTPKSAHAGSSGLTKSFSFSNLSIENSIANSSSIGSSERNYFLSAIQVVDLRSDLISLLLETQLLTELYAKQMKIAKKSVPGPYYYSESLFDIDESNNNEQQSKKGNASNESLVPEMGLALAEFDPSMCDFDFATEGGLRELLTSCATLGLAVRLQSLARASTWVILEHNQIIIDPIQLQHEESLRKFALKEASATFVTSQSQSTRARRFADILKAEREAELNSYHTSLHSVKRRLATLQSFKESLRSEAVDRYRSDSIALMRSSKPAQLSKALFKLKQELIESYIESLGGSTKVIAYQNEIWEEICAVRSKLSSLGIRGVTYSFGLAKKAAEAEAKRRRVRTKQNIETALAKADVLGEARIISLAAGKQGSDEDSEGKISGQDDEDELGGDDFEIDDTMRSLLLEDGSIGNIFYLPSFEEIQKMMPSLAQNTKLESLSNMVDILGSLYDILRFIAASAHLSLPATETVTGIGAKSRVDTVITDLLKVWTETNNMVNPSSPASVSKYLVSRREHNFLRAIFSLFNLCDSLLSSGKKEGFKVVQTTLLGLLSPPELTNMYSSYFSSWYPSQESAWRASTSIWSGRYLSAPKPRSFSSLDRYMIDLSDADRNYANGEDMGVTLLLEDMLLLNNIYSSAQPGISIDLCKETLITCIGVWKLKHAYMIRRLAGGKLSAVEQAALKNQSSEVRKRQAEVQAEDEAEAEGEAVYKEAHLFRPSSFGESYLLGVIDDPDLYLEGLEMYEQDVMVKILKYMRDPTFDRIPSIRMLQNSIHTANLANRQANEASEGDDNASGTAKPSSAVAKISSASSSAIDPTPTLPEAALRQLQLFVLKQELDTLMIVQTTSEMLKLQHALRLESISSALSDGQYESYTKFSVVATFLNGLQGHIREAPKINVRSRSGEGGDEVDEDNEQLLSKVGGSSSTTLATSSSSHRSLTFGSPSLLPNSVPILSSVATASTISTPPHETVVQIPFNDLKTKLTGLIVQLKQWSQFEFNSLASSYEAQISHLKHQLYVSEQTAQQSELRRISERDAVDKRIQAEVTDKGYDLIFEIDKLKYQLANLKSKMKSQEKEIRAQVRIEFEDLVRALNAENTTLKSRFKEYRSNLYTDIMENLHEVKQEALHKVVESENAPMDLKKTTLKISRAEEELAQLKQDNYELRHVVLKLRTMNKLKDGAIRSTYEKKLTGLEKSKYSANRALWDSKLEIERREKMLRDQLATTQRILANAETEVESLKKELTLQQRNKLALVQWKVSKTQLVEELEAKVNQYERWNQVNVDKLLIDLERKDEEIRQLRQAIEEGKLINGGGGGGHHRTAGLGTSRAVNGGGLSSRGGATSMSVKMSQERALKLEAYHRLDRLKESLRAVEEARGEFDLNEEALSWVWQSQYEQATQELKEARKEIAELKLKTRSKTNSSATTANNDDYADERPSSRPSTSLSGSRSSRIERDRGAIARSASGLMLKRPSTTPARLRKTASNGMKTTSNPTGSRPGSRLASSRAGSSLPLPPSRYGR